MDKSCCFLCSKSVKKMTKSQTRELSKDSHGWLFCHLEKVHKKVPNSDTIIICSKDLVQCYKEKKNCQEVCCSEQRQNNISTSNDVNIIVSSISRVGKTNARCVVCRRKVDKSCTTMPKEAILDVLITNSILIPEGSRVCTKHLSGKHLMKDVQIQSELGNKLSADEVEKTVNILFNEIRETIPSPVNFDSDSDMDYQTWTGKLLLVY